MTHILNWATPLSALTSAIAGTNGALAADGQAIANALATSGAAYDTLYGATGVDAAKGSWLTAVAVAWVNADKIALSIINNPTLSPVGFDAYHYALISARIGAATTTDKTLVQELSAAASTVTTLWDPNRRTAAGDGFDPFLQAVLEQYWPGYPRRIAQNSVRTIELAVSVLVDQAVTWTASLA